MANLYLFDIDKTLLINSSDKSYAKPIRNLYAINVDDAQDFSGMTDKLILAKLLRAEGWPEPRIAANMPALISELGRVHAEDFRSSYVTIIPGAEELLDALQAGGHTLGLVTGNLKVIAERKLEAAHICQRFAVGAYGDDIHSSRSELVSLAISRANFQDQMGKVYSVGDTILDVEASLAAGVINVVAVSNGFQSSAELAQAGATIVLNDFVDTASAIRQLNS